MSETPRRPPMWQKIIDGSSGLRLYLLLAVAVTANIVMRQISAMLGRVEAGGVSNTMSVLTAPHVRVDPIEEAGTAWSTVAQETQGLGRLAFDPQEVVASLITWHTYTDLAFVASYALLLAWLLLHLTAPRPKEPSAPRKRLTERFTASRKYAPWAWLFLLALVAADLVENWLTFRFAASIALAIDPRELAPWLMGVTLAKWSLLGFLLLDIAGLLLPAGSSETAATTEQRPTMARIGDVIGSRRPERRIWRRHRVQIGAVVVLGVLVAIPAGGPLDQIPDILRTYADTEEVRYAEYAWSVATLGILCVALWVAGRWALPYGGTRRPGPRPLYVFLAALVSAGIAALAFFVDWPAVRFNGGVFALPLVLAVLWLLWWPFSEKRFVGPKELWRLITRRRRGEQKSTGDPVQVPDEDRRAVGRAGRFLAALPIAIAGLGLVRAFVDPLIASTISEAEKRDSRILLGLALVAVFVAAPLFYALLRGVERLLGGTDVPMKGGRGAEQVVAGAVLVAAGGLAILAAADPITWGPRLNATGSVTVLLALVVLLGGALQVLAERQAPYEPLRRLGLTGRTPYLALLAVAFVLAGMLNVQGGYHALRVLEPGRNDEAGALDLQATFDGWLTEVTDRCTVEGDHAPTDGAAVPLVIVAAPGGGIRAAYWTDRALHLLRDGTTCDDRAIFAASGVSGGSVGLMAHYLHVDESPEDGTLVEDMSDERALAASVAAMAFRDLPAAVLGVSAGWRDRGAILEDAWGESDEAWKTTRLVRDLAPKAHGGSWQPLLLLNGTEVSTGCRLLVSPRRVVASGHAGAPRSCRSAAVTDGTSGIVEGAVDLHWFSDAQACEEETAIRDGDLRASSAALLSARFPYVSPSAELFGCVDGDDEDEDEDDLNRAADLDGGAAENSGLATALDLWEALEPIVTDHNARSQDPVVVPMLVLVDNHYASFTDAVPVGRQRELSAPAGLLSADGVLASQSVLEQEALVTFSGAVPGVTTDDGARPPLRYFRLAPVVRPSLAAPLGWTLSDLTRDDLDDQLELVTKQDCEQRDGMLRPAALACYLDAVGGDPAPK